MADSDRYGNMVRMSGDQSQSIDSSGTKRRSSSRSIKRRRFDDELVESSLGSAGSLGKVARARAQSISSPGLEAMTSGGTTAASTVAPSSTVSVPPENRPRRTGGTSSGRIGGSGGSRRNKRPRHSHSVATKDLGRWKPTDDLALITNVQLTSDLRMVHRATKFSCRFTVQEIQQRWYALLYDQAVSRVAVAAMRNLHPEIVAAVRSRALFSKVEEQLLQTVKSSSNPTLDVFQELLEQNSQVFYPARTAKSLYNHWNLMKQYHLLPDQTVQAVPRGEHVLNFSDAEDLIQDGELGDPPDEAVELELARSDRLIKKEIRSLENEMGNWQVLVDSVTGISPPDFDNQTLAVLRGRLVRYLMRSREIAGLRFIFLVNQELINVIRHEAAKLNLQP